VFILKAGSLVWYSKGPGAGTFNSGGSRAAICRPLANITTIYSRLRCKLQEKHNFVIVMLILFGIIDLERWRLLFFPDHSTWGAKYVDFLTVHFRYFLNLYIQNFLSTSIRFLYAPNYLFCRLFLTLLYCWEINDEGHHLWFFKTVRKEPFLLPTKPGMLSMCDILR
jgi:hypothetical protein